MLVGVLSAGLGGEVFAATPEVTEHGVDRMDVLATELFSRYLLPFEAASILLLATMIGVIALAKRQRAAGERPAEGWPWKKGVEQ